jgi:hypothetical protein
MSWGASNLFPTGSHTFCPICQDPDVWVKPDGTGGWTYICMACGSTGSATQKTEEERKAQHESESGSRRSDEDPSRGLG